VGHDRESAARFFVETQSDVEMLLHRMVQIVRRDLTDRD
jgi:hypothetical protein